MTTSNLFTLSFPDTWKETTVYTFRGPHIDGLQHNLILTIDTTVDKAIELKSYIKGHLNDSRQTMPGFEMIEESETIFPDGSPVSLIVFKYTPAEHVTYYQKLYYVLKENGMYIFTSTFSKNTFKSMSSEVDQIVRSLSVPQGT